MNEQILTYRPSPDLSNDELNALFAAAWPHHRCRDFQPILAHSLVYVCAYSTSLFMGGLEVYVLKWAKCRWV